MILAAYTTHIYDTYFDYTFYFSSSLYFYIRVYSSYIFNTCRFEEQKEWRKKKKQLEKYIRFVAV